MAILEVKNLNVYYSLIQAVKGISFSVEKGEAIALIGANGAGKTTILHTLSGLIPSKSGEILLKGKDITRMPPYKIVNLGMAQVPEGRHVFQHLTVLGNLKLGAYSRKDRENIPRDLETVYHHFPRLKERRSQIAGTLSGGEQQMLAMGRALLSKPDILLLDEPSMGLSPLLVAEIFKIIEQIHESGTTILFVEQNAKMALSVANRAYVLETGKIVMEGKAEELLHDERVRKAYLAE